MKVQVPFGNAQYGTSRKGTLGQGAVRSGAGKGEGKGKFKGEGNGRDEEKVNVKINVKVKAWGEG